MNNKERLIANYGDKLKPKKSFREFCDYIEQTLGAKLINFDLVKDPMRKFLYYNIKMYNKTRGTYFDKDELDIILYVIPKEGKGSRYYKEKYVGASITGYNDYIYIILVKQLEYYMESNCGVLFVDLAIERGISDEDEKNQSLAYLEYLCRVETKENNYYKDKLPIPVGKLGEV